MTEQPKSNSNLTDGALILTMLAAAGVGILVPGLRIPAFATALSLGASRHLLRAYRSHSWSNVAFAGAFSVALGLMIARSTGVLRVPAGFLLYLMGATAFVVLLIVRVRGTRKR